MSTAAARALKERQKNRNLPTIEIPQVKEDELARALRGIQEHIRMYEGDSGAPKERFITIAELENAGLIKSDVKGRFAYISQVLEKDVAQKSGSTANPTQTEPVKADTSRTSRTPSGDGSTASGSTASTAKLNDASDVDVANPANNEFLMFDGNKFTNFPLFKKAIAWFGQQRFEKPVSLREQETAPEALEGLGYLYLKDAVLRFLDATGTDFSLLVKFQTVTVAATTAIDYTAGQAVLLDLQPASITTLTLDNPLPSGEYNEFRLEIVQGSTARTITWPASVKWPSDVAPVLTTTDNAVDIVHLWSRDGGTTWHGTFVLDSR